MDPADPHSNCSHSTGRMMTDPWLCSALLNLPKSNPRRNREVIFNIQNLVINQLVSPSLSLLQNHVSLLSMDFKENKRVF